MFHLLIQHHHLIIKAASPEMVAATARLFQHFLLSQPAGVLPAGHFLQGLVCVFGSSAAGKAGPLVVEKLKEAAMTLDLVSDLKSHFATVAQGQEKLLAAAAAKLPPGAESKTTLDLPAKEANKHLRAVGRLQYAADFTDVWLGGEHYDLHQRAKARFCLQFLVRKKAFSRDTARHLEREIDPFVRKKSELPPAAEIKLQHYFNDRAGKLSRLRRELVKAAGRNGRFYLQVT